jgi:predicted PurR-regulated permease PerM
MPPQRPERFLFLALSGVAAYLMFQIFRPFLAGFAWAIVLVVTFHPLYARLTRLLRGWGWLAAWLLAGFLAAFLVIPAVLVVVKVGQGVGQLYEWLRPERGTEGFLGPEPLAWWKAIEERIGAYVDVGELDVRAAALSTLEMIGKALAARTGAFLSNAIASLLTLFVLVIATAVLFHDGPALLQSARRLVPLPEEDREDVFRRLEEVTRAVFVGVVSTAAVQAVLGAVGWAMVGLPWAVTFGAAMFFCALLPAGTVVVWGPGAVWLAASGHPVKAVVLLAWGALVVGTADNLLRPLFIGRGLKIPAVLVFFSILGGMMAFGFLGLFLGPLVVTLFLFLVEVGRRELEREPRPDPEQPPEKGGPGR